MEAETRMTGTNKTPTLDAKSQEPRKTTWQWRVAKKRRTGPMTLLKEKTCQEEARTQASRHMADRGGQEGVQQSNRGQGFPLRF